MLINFSVSYFRSFGEEQTLNLIALDHNEHPTHLVKLPNSDKKILKLGVIYGANASGKSNLVKAIAFAQQMILGRISLGRLASHGFRFLGKIKPLSFEFRFLSAGYIFVYGFSATSEKISEEWLAVVSKSGKENTVFDRSSSEIRIGELKSLEGKEEVRKILKAIKDFGIKNESLVLEVILNNSDLDSIFLLNAIKSWFADQLTVIPASSHFLGLADLINRDQDFRAFCSGFLKNSGTGVDEVKVETSKVGIDHVPQPIIEHLQSQDDSKAALLIDESQITFELDAGDPKSLTRKTLNAFHLVAKKQYSLPFYEESDGTQRCLNLLPALFDVTNQNTVYVVDEIDRSLHPLLCFRLLALFLKARMNNLQQLVVTTHETHLLNPALLRWDEVWFIEKLHNQQSRLAPLSDWAQREDLILEKGYLQGRYGGEPYLSDLQKLMDLIQHKTGEL